MTTIGIPFFSRKCSCFPATFGMPARVAAKPNKPCLEESVAGKVKMIQPDVFLRIWHGAIHAYVAIICNIYIYIYYIFTLHVLNYTTIYIYLTVFNLFFNAIHLPQTISYHTCSQPRAMNMTNMTNHHSPCYIDMTLQLIMSDPD